MTDEATHSNRRGGRRRPGVIRQVAAAAVIAAPVAAGPMPPCAEPDAHCFEYATFSALQATTPIVRTADDFMPQQDASISAVCFWGAYAPNSPSDDDFTVTYYKSTSGLPGEIIAGPFQQGIDLTLQSREPTGDTIPQGGTIFAYNVTHPPVPVEQGTCYWISIGNDPAVDRAWYWSFSEDTAGNGFALVDVTPDDPFTAEDVNDTADLAFCLDAPIESSTCVRPMPKPTPAECLALHTQSATLSNSTAVRCADDFALLSPGSVSTITFWGAYDNDLITTDAFTVRYYADAGGIPGALLAGPFMQGSDLTLLSRAATDETIDGSGEIIYEFVASHPSVALPAEQCAWLEIRNDPTGPARWYWSWSHDAKGNGFCYVGASPSSPIGPFDAEPGHDFAFCVTSELGTSRCAETFPDLPGCGAPNESSCCAVHPSGGCANATCCNSVCLLDPFCCKVEWDLACVAQAILNEQPCDCPDLPPAACCFPGGFCAELTFTQCNAAGGAYSPLYDCIDNQCVLPCILDVNEDLSVGVQELFFLLNQWGDCGTGDCLGADIAGGPDDSGDGVVNVFDLFKLLENWGPCL